MHFLPFQLGDFGVASSAKAQDSAVPNPLLSKKHEIGRSFLGKILHSRMGNRPPGYFAGFELAIREPLLSW